MTPSDFDTIARIEADLWSAADNLRANSKLTSSEYCMPVLGVIFLRHASNRYNTALAQIEAAQAAGEMPKRKLRKADFVKRRALMLPEQARYHKLLELSKSENLGKKLVEAMKAIEKDFEPLKGQLPKDYEKFESDLLEALLRTFDSEALRQASGDVFGRIYEYFLMKFAMQGAQDNGEFFTPPSLVQLIVNVIEPDHGVVADLACGSGGMFVQSSHFIEQHGQETMKRATFYGQEKTATTIRLAKMNLAVHGLEGDIREANTFYQDEHRLSDGRPLWGNCDFIMANPPFNVDMVDAAKIKGDRRLPFGLPGVNKENKVSNGNYLWISYFHSYLSGTGRAGFVMSSQASSAGNKEAEVRKSLVQTGDVDVMVSIRANFFYTRTVPCELWFFDRGKASRHGDSPEAGPAPSPPAPLPEGEGRKKHYRGGYDFSGLLKRARELRKKQTPAEEFLWQLLRNRKLDGLKFRRQHQIGDYITDFYCDEIKLVIELDGTVHTEPAQMRKDETRQKHLEALGLTVLRFPNEQILQTPEEALQTILSSPTSGQTHHPTDSSLPSPSGRRAGDEGRSAPHHPKGHVLMLDARNIYRKVTRKIYDFSPEQQQNLTAVVWLHRDERLRFAELCENYRQECIMAAAQLDHTAHSLSTDQGMEGTPFLVACLNKFSAMLKAGDDCFKKKPKKEDVEAYADLAAPLFQSWPELQTASAELREFMETHRASLEDGSDPRRDLDAAIGRYACNLDRMKDAAARFEDYRKLSDRFGKQVAKTADLAAKKFGARRLSFWKKDWNMPELLDELQRQLEAIAQPAQQYDYFRQQLHWLLTRFPEGRYTDVPGLCKRVTETEIEAADWSLTPGRYVGVAPVEEDEDFDFAQTMTDIHHELAELDKKAGKLGKAIQKNFEGLGV